MAERIEDIRSPADVATCRRRFDLHENQSCSNPLLLRTSLPGQFSNPPTDPVVHVPIPPVHLEIPETTTILRPHRSVNSTPNAKRAKHSND